MGFYNDLYFVKKWDTPKNLTFEGINMKKRKSYIMQIVTKLGQGKKYDYFFQFGSFADNKCNAMKKYNFSIVHKISVNYNNQ